MLELVGMCDRAFNFACYRVTLIPKSVVLTPDTSFLCTFLFHYYFKV